MKTKPVFTLTVLLLGFILMASGAFAEKQIQMTRCGGPCMGMGIENLTEAQEKKIEALRFALTKEMTPLKADLKVKEAELEKLLVSGDPQWSAIEKKVDEISALKATLQKKRLKNRLAVRALLTPEQQVEFDRNRSHGHKRIKMIHKMHSMDGPGQKRIMKFKLPGDLKNLEQEIEDMEIEVDE